MLRIADMNIAGVARAQIAQIMQGALCATQPVGIAPALRTWPAPVITTTLGSLGFRKILNTGNSFRLVWNVFSWLGHDDNLQNNSAFGVFSPLPSKKSRTKLCNNATLSFPEVI